MRASRLWPVVSDALGKVATDLNGLAFVLPIVPALADGQHVVVAQQGASADGGYVGLQRDDQPSLDCNTLLIDLLHNLVDSSTRRASKTLSLEVYTHIVWMFPPIRSKAARDAHGLLEPDLPRHRNADALVVPGRQGLAHQPHHTSTQQYYLHGVKLR